MKTSDVYSLIGTLLFGLSVLVIAATPLVKDILSKRKKR